MNTNMARWTKAGDYSHALMWRVEQLHRCSCWWVRTYQHGKLLRADIAVVDDFGDLIAVS